MRNYAFSGDLKSMTSMDYDVAIIGSGVAGLYAALSLDKRINCAVFNKLGSEESNSIHAQGGVAAVTEPYDSVESHITDTLSAGAGLCNVEAVNVLVREGPKEIKNLIELGVPFDVDGSGKFHITREAAHSCNRILHCHGDATGLHLTKALQDRFKERDNLHMFENLTLVDILTDDTDCVCGVIMESTDNRYYKINTSNVILAAGGIGKLYRNSTNAASATGDGIAAAMRAGAAMENLEFVQFHPTALVHPDPSGRFFLISEALRGEGAVLRNRKWEAFMKDAHPLADLAPRDIVSRAIIMEMKKYDLPNVYLDITHQSREFLEKRFPTIYQECMRRGIDIAVDWIPVVPVQHYYMGGIKTDTLGRTNKEGLYACGENACTGIHGANRLASNSLLECLVFGKRCALDISLRRVTRPEYSPAEKLPNTLDISTIRSKIRDNMTKKGGIMRNRTDMLEAVTEIRADYDKLSDVELRTTGDIETYNMSAVATAILDAAISREKSVGAHYRSDEVK